MWYATQECQEFVQGQQIKQQMHRQPLPDILR